MNGNGSIRTVDGRRGRAGSSSLLAAVAVLVLALAASCGGASEGGGQPSGTGGQGAPTQAPQGSLAAARYVLGDAGAPVVLTEYGDYG